MRSMTNQAKNKPKALYSKDREKAVSGLMAMDHIDHGSEVSVEITTPLGQRLTANTHFIGYDNKKHIFYSLPAMKPAEMDLYLQVGFWVFVTCISERAEGAIVKFKTCIDHVIRTPVGLMILKLPEQATLFQLRGEMRYQLNINGFLLTAQRRMEVALKDISMSGCCFSYQGIAPVFESGQEMTLEVASPDSGETFPLSGIIRNRRVHRGRQEYGLQFDDTGTGNCKKLLSRLIFDGAKLVFRQPKPAPKAQ
ncbi:PilZ domain-containing protein [Shewanella khirikhana]|nr:flagellar brake protein [Shewanella khirikhana]